MEGQDWESAIPINLKKIALMTPGITALQKNGSDVAGMATRPFLRENIVHLIERVADAKEVINVMASKKLDPEVVKEFAGEAKQNLTGALELLERMLYETGGRGF